LVNVPYFLYWFDFLDNESIHTLTPAAIVKLTVAFFYLLICGHLI
jgi:hypothetical protein